MARILVADDASFMRQMKALEAGAKDFIVKPFKPDAVIETLSKALEKEDQ
jgi:DNA-binding NtrC family response regulator